jgi:hypothetical protein
VALLNHQKQMALFSLNKAAKTKGWAVWQSRLVSYGLFAIFSLLLFLTVREIVRDHQLQKDGIYIDGTVFDSGNGRGGYYIRYSFQYNHATYQGSCAAKQAWVYAAHLPSPVRVKFMAKNPDVNTVPDARDLTMRWLDPFFAGFYCLGILFLGLVIFQELFECLNDRKSKRVGSQPWQLPSYPKGWH